MSLCAFLAMLELSSSRQEVDVMSDARKSSTMKAVAWAYEWALGVGVVCLVVLVWSSAAAG